MQSLIHNTPSVRLFVKYALGILAVYAFFSYATPWAQASSLTEPQIKAIMGLLASFGADQQTIANTESALRESGAIAMPESTATESDTAPAPVATSTSTASDAPASFSLGVDASSPAYALVPGGSSGVTVGVMTLRAAGGPISLTAVGLRLKSGTPGDVLQTQLYSDGKLLGAAVFSSANPNTLVTLKTPISLARGADAKITIKADFASIGPNQQGISGDFVKIDPVSAGGTSFASGSAVAATVTGSTSGVRLFRSFPSVLRPALPENGLSDGRLLRFSITANAAGDVSIAALNFYVTASGAMVTNPGLFAYTESTFTTAAPDWSATVTASGTRYSAILSAPLVIPAGQTRFFELRAAVAAASGSSVVTTLLGDATYNGIGTAAAQKEKSYFVWSDNALGVSSGSTVNWMNGSGVPGLSATGVTQVRRGDGAQSISATIDASSLTSTSGSPTLTGTLIGTSSAALLISAGDKASGTGTINAQNGRWSAIIAPPLPAGKYKVSIVSGGTTLVTGDLSIVSATSTTAKPSASAGGLGPMVAAAAAAPFNLLVEALTDLFIYAGIGR